MFQGSVVREMERTESNGPVSTPNSSYRANSFGSASFMQRSDHSSRAVEEALRHLACIDLGDLCKEAKVERCRATRDLASCRRDVQYVLTSCGHAALCTECSQRCDICPVCRTALPNSGKRLRIRLYYECVEAGLIPRMCEDRSQDAEDNTRVIADVERLYSLFDIAMGNNLISVICHYVTEVCMDERAVSSDPVTAFLLDEVVVKDWVKRTFRSIVAELHITYNLEIEDMKAKLDMLLKYSTHLTCITSVLEVLESAFGGTLLTQLQDLHQLHENVQKLKQHVDVMVWCIRHNFLENVESRFIDITSWRSLVRERKSAAVRRAWPDTVEHPAECGGREGSLFIEDALENLEIEQDYSQEVGGDFEIACLQKDPRIFFRSKIEGISGCYPFDNLQTAVDILFLRGRSDLVLAKQAILLYYLFDRHWSIPDRSWRHILDDFAATFGVARHLLLESFAFFLLDDHTEAALQEACRILPEMCGPETHPKIARVLLERQNPETALMVLRWSGCEGRTPMLSINEAVTALRIRVECGLLSEAFTYQRMFCIKVKEIESKSGPPLDTSDDIESKCRNGEDWMEILVTEFCCLSIRRNLVDRIIELPWNSEEEKYLHKCLLDSAADDPSSIVGSLLVVFYLQRHRYIEAYQVNLELQKMEERLIIRNAVGPELLSRMMSQRHWRAELADKGIELLPAIQQQQLRAGQLPELTVLSNLTTETSTRPDGLTIASSDAVGVPVSALPNSTPLQGHVLRVAPESSHTRTSVCRWSGNNPISGLCHGSSSILLERLFRNTERGQKTVASAGGVLKFNDTLAAGRNLLSPLPSTPFKDMNRSSSRASASKLKGLRFNKISPEPETDGFLDQLQNGKCPRFFVTENLVTTTPVRNRLVDDLGPSSHHNVPVKRSQFDRNYGSWNFGSSDDPMDVSSGFKDGIFPVENGSTKSGPLRWRSDETSDEENDLLYRMGETSRAISVTRRRQRFFRR